MENSRGSNPDVSGEDRRSRSIKDSHPEGMPAPLFDPFQVQNAIAV